MIQKKNGRKTIALLAALLVALPLVGLAEATGSQDLMLNAVVEARHETALRAPASGELADFNLKAGDLLEQGDILFTVEPRKVYSAVEGTVAAVYAQAGGIADAAVERYGSVLAIERADRYELKCSVMTGYNSKTNRNPYVGTHVWLRSANEKRFADGIITAVNGTQFTVAVTGGDLEHGEDVKVYRDPSYEDKYRLARSELSAVAPAAVSATGTVIEMAVKAGDAVQPGDYLFSYVPDELDPERRGQAGATLVKAESALLISQVSVQQGATVQKGQALCTAYPQGDIWLSAQVEEGDIGRIAVGDVFEVRFEEADLPPTQATVAEISPLGAQGDVAKYTVYLELASSQNALPGMHATLGR